MINGNYLEILRKLENPDVLLQLLRKKIKYWDEFNLATREIKKLEQCLKDHSGLHSIDWLNVTVSTFQNSGKDIFKIWYLNNTFLFLLITSLLCL